MVTGSLSGVTVLDWDPRHFSSDSQQHTLVYGGDAAITGGGGTHWYCANDSSLCGNATSVLPGLDIRGEGGYVVAPPSKTTGSYRFTSEMVPPRSSLPTLGSTGILELLQTKRSINKQQDLPKRSTQAGSFVRLSFLPAASGHRNDVASRMAGSIVRYTGSYADGLQILQLWNRSSCKPPLDLYELELVYKSIYTKHHLTKKDYHKQDSGSDQVTGSTT